MPTAKMHTVQRPGFWSSRAGRVIGALGAFVTIALVTTFTLLIGCEEGVSSSGAGADAGESSATVSPGPAGASGGGSQADATSTTAPGGTEPDSDDDTAAAGGGSVPRPTVSCVRYCELFYYSSCDRLLDTYASTADCLEKCEAQSAELVSCRTEALLGISGQEGRETGCYHAVGLNDAPEECR